MNILGFLMAGRAVYDSGKASNMRWRQVAKLDRLYTHAFPGARSREQVYGALALVLELPAEPVAAGEQASVRVKVDNSRTGHGMPSGSVEVRYIVLELQVQGPRGSVQVAATPRNPASGYDVSGKDPWDATIYGAAFPPGQRLYRTVFADAAGKPTLASYSAVKVLFDNRLQANEVREETYSLMLPQDVQGPLRLTATLRYFPYPHMFARRLKLPKALPVSVATATATLTVKPPAVR